MTKQEKLLNKYYKGETSLEEEKELKILIRENKNSTPEQDIFGFYDSEISVPNNLEESITQNFETKQKHRSTIRRRLYSWSSVAAILIILFTVYVDFRKTKHTQIENDFFVMEQALFQISESIQPEETEEMLVLWVDDDVEIIIN